MITVHWFWFCAAASGGAIVGFLLGAIMAAIPRQE